MFINIINYKLHLQVDLKVEATALKFPIALEILLTAWKVYNVLERSKHYREFSAIA